MTLEILAYNVKLSRTDKATREIIYLGNIELDVFMLPNGDYAMSQTQVTKALKKANNSIIQFLSGKSSEALQYKGSELSKSKVEGSNRAMSVIPLDLAALYWVYWAKKGNELASALVFASAVESLELRADNAFGKRMTIEERNTKFQVRVDGILSRNFWTDTIAQWMVNPENKYSENYERWIWANVSDKVNRAVFGLSAKQVREYYGLKTDQLVRDRLPASTLRDIDMIEKGAANRVKNFNIEPKDAIQDILDLLGYQPDPTRL